MTGGSKKDKGQGGSGPKTIAMSSPLYFDPSDNPSMNVTHIIFNGDNYDMWAEAVKNGLDAKNNMGFIEGNIKEPDANGDDGEDNIKLVAWRQCNAIVRAWLRNIIDPKLHPSITFSQPIKEILDELKERNSSGNAPRVHQLKGELNECKQGRDSVVEYYTKLKAIWDELGNYSKIKECTCGAAASIVKEREEEKVHQFLMGLDSRLYGNLRSTLLMDEPIVSLSRPYATTLREENHIP
ncbi:hypothetical protein vseg_019650 [Gypsophila vaccaria]